MFLYQSVQDNSISNRLITQEYIIVIDLSLALTFPTQFSREPRHVYL